MNSRRFKKNNKRNWFLRNKVFFEVGAAILLGLASFVVSFSSLKVSERSLAATEITSLPHFSLSTDPRYDPAIGKFVEETLILSNYGAPIYNWNWSTKTFIGVEYYGQPKGTFYLPIGGYYTAHFNSSVPSGQLAHAYIPENLQNFSKLYMDALNAKDEFGIGIHIELVTISEVSYEDRFGRRNKIFFRQKSKVSEESVSFLLESSKKLPLRELTAINVKDLQRKSGKIFVPE